METSPSEIFDILLDVEAQAITLEQAKAVLGEAVEYFDFLRIKPNIYHIMPSRLLCY